LKRLILNKSDQGSGMTTEPEWRTPAGVWILGWSKSRCQAKFLTCYCLSIILLLRVKE